jgi:nucleoside-diphosphate-sugar epimerase
VSAGAAPAPGPAPHGTCVITGATGFIGGCLAERLARNGRRVRCLIRAGSDTSRLRELGVELVVGDLADRESLARAFAGAEQAVHCAALVSDWATRAEIAATNVTGTRNLLDACKASPVRRLVHLSTTDVYGHPGGPPVQESRLGGRFANWYAQTKLEAEGEVRRAAAGGELDAVILRPATVYGPGSREVVGQIASAIRRRQMLLIDGGRAIAGLCFVENLIDAVVIALQHPSAPGRVFNITDGLEITWRRFTGDLAAALERPAPRWSIPYGLASALGLTLEHGYRLLRRGSGLTVPPLLSRQAVQVLGRDQAFSNRQARELLGWTPRVDYETGLARTVAWLRSEHLAGLG